MKTVIKSTIQPNYFYVFYKLINFLSQRYSFDEMFSPLFRDSVQSIYKSMNFGRFENVPTLIFSVNSNTGKTLVFEFVDKIGNSERYDMLFDDYMAFKYVNDF